ncbi:hypothetical protein H2200_004902 [Cladophialophora chaetospira]|uniref:Uncharacterized protein n=1 Tax=Cladophialophora chaetospira TaxID=386627 RepID=A0AA39CKL3_9EURO|nr:hypothetical protein H2200_004902 [Cladophialophora chaetospira]
MGCTHSKSVSKRSNQAARANRPVQLGQTSSAAASSLSLSHPRPPPTQGVPRNVRFGTHTKVDRRTISARLDPKSPEAVYRRGTYQTPAEKEAFARKVYEWELAEDEFLALPCARDPNRSSQASLDKRLLTASIRKEEMDEKEEARVAVDAARRAFLRSTMR